MCKKLQCPIILFLNAFFHKIEETEFTIVNKLVAESLVLL